MHELIDRLQPTQLAALASLLEAMLQRGDEQISDEEERAVAEAKQWLAAHGGKGIPHEEVLADLGLNLDEFLRMGEKRAERRRG